MVAAASGFVRIKIRVPEGYLIVGPYQTTRPALLVIDADGRRVGSFKLLRAEAASLAQQLRGAKTAPALERWELQKGEKRWVVNAKPGYTPPKDATVLHPIAVTSVKPLPGAWARKENLQFVPRLLVHALDGTDLEAKTFLLPKVSKGPPGARVAMAPLKVKGVLSVFPDIWGDTQVVVGRKGKVDWKQVTAAFTAAGCAARLK